jgi:hypothetical protein
MYDDEAPFDDEVDVIYVPVLYPSKITTDISDLSAGHDFPPETLRLRTCILVVIYYVSINTCKFPV